MVGYDMRVCVNQTVWFVFLNFKRLLSACALPESWLFVGTAQNDLCVYSGSKAENVSAACPVCFRVCASALRTTV